VWIVGRKIPDWLIEKSKKDSSVKYTENIPDARDAYKAASIMVAPIKGAGGSRLKILEAMATGLPVVSTKIGVAGLDVKDGKNAMIAETYKGLAKKAIKLLEDSDFANSIGEEGRKHVKKYFDWRSIVKLHDPIYKNLVKNG
jgi:glycosyltransferase involved in cell wall biosynthesis